MKNKEIIIAPSLLASDFSNLEKHVRRIKKIEDYEDGKYNEC